MTDHPSLMEILVVGGTSTLFLAGGMYFIWLLTLPIRKDQEERWQRLEERKKRNDE